MAYSELEELLLEARKTIAAAWQEVFRIENEGDGIIAATPVLTIDETSLFYTWGITEIDGVPVVLAGNCASCGAGPDDPCPNEDDNT